MSEKKKIIITIARQYGSGGADTGKKLAEDLGISFYDKNILRMNSDESGIKESYFHLADEKAGNRLLYKIINTLTPEKGAPSFGSDLISADNLFRFQSEVIRKLAAEATVEVKVTNSWYDPVAEGEAANALMARGCVIIGRCADYVLDGTEGLIRVFLYADIKVREERVRERNLYADKDVLKNIHRIDRERRDYNRYYAGRDWEKPENYDLLINTTQIGVDGAVQLIKDYLKMRGLL